MGSSDIALTSVSSVRVEGFSFGNQSMISNFVISIGLGDEYASYLTFMGVGNIGTSICAKKRWYGTAIAWAHHLTVGAVAVVRWIEGEQGGWRCEHEW